MEKLDDTHGAVLELNRTLNDMHESTRKDLADLLTAPTPSPVRIIASRRHICQRRQPLK